MRKVWLVALVMGLFPLAGCLPDLPVWPNGLYVHPKFVGASDPGPCVIGMTADLASWADTVREYYAEDGGDNIEWWYSFGSDLSSYTVSTATCWNDLFNPRVLYWTCGHGQINAYDPGLGMTPEAWRIFRLCWDCQPDGSAAWGGSFYNCQGAGVLF